jgi:hypothetical protein
LQHPAAYGHPFLHCVTRPCSCCCFCLPLCCKLLLVLQGNWDCAKKILRNHGLRGIYSGYVATLLRDMQGYAWFFFGYEATIHYLAGPGKTKADLDYMQVGTCVCCNWACAAAWWCICRPEGI